ncbi:MAG TPA: ATP-binding cassette domain-containing protein [Bacteroidia bacterium]|nr:ATP-binding cassette domain-containing protein [Bacteroidia bacterium]
MFAIIAKVDGITNTGRNIVQSYLKQQLNQEQVEKYLKIFDEYLEQYHQVSQKKEGAAKKTALNSVKILKICSQINEELEQTQKFVVLVRLIEFIHSSNQISEQELEFVETVAEVFNIDRKDFENIKNLVEQSISDVPDSDEFLIISHQAPKNVSKTKFLFNENIVNGEIRVLRIETVNLYILKVFGEIDIQLNGQNVDINRVYVLTHGSSLRSSKIKPIYYSDIIGRFLADEHTFKITFEATDVEYKFKNGKIGLRDINLFEESGTLVGIMGGSGAGKSTLMNVLNGSEKPSKGKVLINGIDIHKEPEKIEGVIGHVPQDDLLIEELTVFENLFYNAKLCFGNLDDEEIKKKCDALLSDLGLSETANLKVGSPLEKTISGGQRKRLNIALELIREPSVLFLDEPTSGLSSRDSENIMDLLKELTLKGKLIFVVIHQPSSDIFKMFDKLIILDVGGYLVYYGNPVDSVSYFKRLINHANAEETECPHCGNVNPEQVFNIIESKVLDEYGNLTKKRKTSPAEWNRYYKELIEKYVRTKEHFSTIPEAIFKIPNKIQQFKVFLTRDVKSKLTNTQYLLINFLEAPALAFILSFLIRYYNTDVDTGKGYIFRENDNVPAYLFMAVVVALFIGMMVSAEEIIRDRKIRKREAFLNLSKGSYLLSKVVIMFVLSAIQTFTFIIVGNNILGVNGLFTDYWLVLFSTSCFANMLGLNISAAFNSVVTIYISVPFLIIPQLILSGVIVKFDKLNPLLTQPGNVPWSGEVMTSRWAYEALAVNQFKNNNFEKHFYIYDKVISNAQYKKVYWIPKLQNKLTKIEDELKDKNHNVSILIQDINLVKNEILKEYNTNKSFQKILKNKEEIQSLSINTISVESINTIRNYLYNLNNYYIDLENAARKKKDEKARSMQKTPAEKEAFVKLEEENENEALNQLVTNSNDISGERCMEKDGKLIRRIDLVFYDPEDSNLGGAHFYAPRKKFLGMYIDTLYFNTAVIWLMTIILWITLYFDVFKKVLCAFGNFGKLFKKESDTE